MNLAKTPARGWDDRIAFPLQSVGYARAAGALGHQPLFVEDERGIALVLMRRVPVPLLGAWTARAKVYAHAREATFLPALVEELRKLGVSHVKIGDAMWGVSGRLPDEWRGFRRVEDFLCAHGARAHRADRQRWMALGTFAQGLWRRTF